MMPHSGKLGGRGSGGRYRDVAIDLSAVGGNDPGGESPGYVDSKGRLPGGCRPCYYYNCLFPIAGNLYLTVRGQRSATMRQMFTITSTAFSIEETGTYSYRPWEVLSAGENVGTGESLE